MLYRFVVDMELDREQIADKVRELRDLLRDIDHVGRELEMTSGDA